MKRYQEEVLSGIKSRARGHGKGVGRILSLAQESALKKMIMDKLPDPLTFDFVLWTRKAVQERIDQEYSIKIPIKTVGDYLKRWQFTPQKPAKRAYEQNPKAVQRWLDED